MAGAQFHVRHLHAVVNASYRHAFFTPIKLKGFAELKRRGHEGFAVRFASLHAPRADEIGDAAVAARVALGLDLHEQCLAAFPALRRPLGIGFEG